MTSVDPQIKQMTALLNRHGHDLSRQFEWEKLDKEFLISTVSYDMAANLTLGSPIVTVADTTGLSTNFGVFGVGVTPFANILSIDSSTQFTMNMPATESGTPTLSISQVAYPLPADWLKQIPQTEWDRTNRWPLMGPKSPQEWQSYKSGIVYAGPRERFRIQSGAVQISPNPPNGLIFSYEYISSAWVIGADGVYKQNLALDDDTYVFDDSLMVTGLKMRWKQAKGLDYSYDAQEYGSLLNLLRAQDKSAPKLSRAPIQGSIYLSPANIPDGSWGQV
jgi:hypothetical protein